MKKSRFVFLLLLVCLAAALLGGCAEPLTLSPSLTEDGLLHIITLDTGDSDAHILLTPEGGVLLVDTGLSSTYSVLKGALSRLGIAEIDALILTHPHKDHIGGAEALLSDFSVSEIYTAPTSHSSDTLDSLLAAVDEKGIPLHTVTADDMLSLGGLSLRVLSPTADAEFDEVNDESLVLSFTHGSLRFLMMGDAEKTAEKDMLRRYPADVLAADYLKAGHHGDDDASSKSFLSACQPAVAVITADREADPDHANAETLERFARVRTAVYVTDEHGAICVSSDGETLSIRTER